MFGVTILSIVMEVVGTVYVVYVLRMLRPKMLCRNIICLFIPSHFHLLKHLTNFSDICCVRRSFVVVCYKFCILCVLQ